MSDSASSLNRTSAFKASADGDKKSHGSNDLLAMSFDTDVKPHVDSETAASTRSAAEQHSAYDRQPSAEDLEVYPLHGYLREKIAPKNLSKF